MPFSTTPEFINEMICEAPEDEGIFATRGPTPVIIGLELSPSDLQAGEMNWRLI